MLQIVSNRRRFLTGSAAAAAATFAVPRYLRAGGSPNEKVNVAFVAAGGKGVHAVKTFGLGRLADQVNLAAFCDVDETYAASSYNAFPKVARYTDYRKMYDQLERRIDAVVVSTPDHHHFPASMMALARGKHVYCEKPLTYRPNGPSRSRIPWASF